MLYYSSYSSNFYIFTLLRHPLMSYHPYPSSSISASLFSHFYHIYSSVGRTGLVLDETRLVTALPTPKQLQPPTPWGPVEPLHSHGDLMLMVTVETAGEPPVRWMARSLSWRFPPQSRPCKENQACNTQLLPMLQAWEGGCWWWWYANVISASILLLQSLHIHGSL